MFKKLLAIVGAISIVGFMMSFQGNPKLQPASVAMKVHPRHFVEITENSPYTVPQDKLLVITALGRTSGTPSVNTSVLTINGESKAIVYLSINLPHEPQMIEWPMGLIAEEGDFVETPSDDGAAYGFLVDE